MRLHSDTLTPDTIAEALSEAKAAGTVAPTLYFEELDMRGSRSRQRAFEVKLASTAKAAGDKRHRPNNGTRGRDTSDVWAATYDEWGQFIARLYERDAEATFGPYKSASDFHAKTRYAYGD